MPQSHSDEDLTTALGRIEARLEEQERSSDLGAALASPELADFEHLYILGFSLGGHLALHYATGVGVDPRLRAVAAVCAPLDLEACVDDFDQPNRWLYRRRILSALKDLYRPVARRREMPVPVERVEAIRGIREWDELTVVPRFGFRDTADYYARAGVASRLGRLRVPALLIAAEDDPMVTARAVRSGLAVTSRHDLRVEWAAKSGHIGFPPGLDLGLGGEPGLENQALHWLLEESHT
ncbi:MAG: alpha/beta fold hydrolase [Acidobacteriota bacterium]